MQSISDVVKNILYIYVEREREKYEKISKNDYFIFVRIHP